MFDDDDDSRLKKQAGLPLALETLSAGELDRYAALLHEELARVAAEKARKQALKKSAADFFKSEESHG